MTVLSLFDGISCGHLALKRANIPVKKYYASEIDKYAEKISQHNFSGIIRLGDINNWKTWQIEKPDLILAGSPCQGFSFAGKQLNFDDPRSALFFVFADILKHYKPQYFLLENVKMKTEYSDTISSILGEIYPESVQSPDLFTTGKLEPVLINSALVSAQNRERLYWCNWKVPQPQDKKIILKDIIESEFVNRKKSLCIKANECRGNGQKVEHYFVKGYRQVIFENNTKFKPLITGAALRSRKPENPSNRKTDEPTRQRLEINATKKANCLTTVSKGSLCAHVGFSSITGYERGKRVYSTDKKSPTITAIQGGNQVPKILNELETTWRELTVTECERLQTLPDDFCGVKSDVVSKSRALVAIGNGWTVDVIVHILLCGIKRSYNEQ